MAPRFAVRTDYSSRDTRSAAFVPKIACVINFGVGDEVTACLTLFLNAPALWTADGAMFLSARSGHARVLSIFSEPDHGPVPTGVVAAGQKSGAQKLEWYVFSPSPTARLMGCIRAFILSEMVMQPCRPYGMHHTVRPGPSGRARGQYHSGYGGRQYAKYCKLVGFAYFCDLEPVITVSSITGF